MGSGITSEECSEDVSFNISEEEVPLWENSQTDAVMVTVLIPVILSFSLITNISFLYILYRTPKLRSDTNLYLAHLSLADLMYITLSFVLRIWTYTSSPIKHNMPFTHTAHCTIFLTVVNTGYFVSVVLVTMVSFERYLALCHPIKHLALRGYRRTNKAILICWLVGAFFALSTSLDRSVFSVQCLEWPKGNLYLDFPSKRGICGPAWSWTVHVIPPLLNVPWIIAIVANLNMYVLIWQVLNRRTVKTRPNKNIQAKVIRNQVGKMLIVNGTVFFVCQVPYRIFSFADWICLLAGITNPLTAALGGSTTWISAIPQYINTAINPLIYGATNTAIRDAFIQAFGCPHQDRNGGQYRTSRNMSRRGEDNLAMDKNSDNQL